MVNIILILFALFMLYILAILIIQMVKRVDTKTAKKILLDFLKDCLSQKADVQKPEYPVWVGIDENGFPNADYIHRAFGDLRKIFDTVIFQDMKYTQNHILYIFKVGAPLKEMSEYEIIKCCERICNAIVHHNINTVNPYLRGISNLIHIKLINDRLYVYVARNENGAQENFSANDSARITYSNQPKQEDEIKERW